MTTDKIPPDRRVILEQQENGVFLASYTWKTYRFMMNDGSTVDIKAVRDDSDLRGAVLDLTKAEAIVGVASLNGAVPSKTPTKRVAKRQARS